MPVYGTSPLIQSINILKSFIWLLMSDLDLLFWDIANSYSLIELVTWSFELSMLLSASLRSKA